MTEDAPDAARAHLRSLILTGDNRLKQGGPVQARKARETYEQALAEAEAAGLHDDAHPRAAGAADRGLPRARGSRQLELRGSREHVDDPRRLARHRVGLGGRPRARARGQRRAAHERGRDVVDVVGIAQLAGDPLASPRAPAGTPRATTTGRPQASASMTTRPKPSRCETRQATSQARNQRGTSAGGTPVAMCTLSPIPRSAASCCRASRLRPVAHERERTVAPGRARDGEGRQQALEVLGRHEVADVHDARPARLPAERAESDLAVAVDEGVQVDARADDVQALAERAR